MAKVFDCFTFFNEIEILELRLQETFDTVDCFVIVESDVTFTGHRKPLHFREHAARFRPYMDKIVHVVVQDGPESDNPFDREHFQRNAIVRGLGGAEPDDTILISDVDELIRPEAIRQATSLDGYVCFNMPMYQFYLNLRERPAGWLAAYGFHRKDLDSVFDLSRSRWNRKRIQEAFPQPDRFHVIANAGWHFTHLGGIARLQQKFMAYSHSPDPWPRAMLAEGSLKKHITAGGIVGNFFGVSKFVPIDESFPKTVLARQSHFKEIGFIKDVYEALDELQAEHRGLKEYLALEHYDDPRPRPVLYGLPPREYATMARLQPPFPTRLAAIRPRTGTLLSQGRRATQSSVSQWSIGKTVETDASGALDGAKTGTFRFHTAAERDPWWMVDLDGLFTITEIHIYNRLFPLGARQRAAHLKIAVGTTPDALVEVFRKDDDRPFGGADGDPLIWAADRPIIGRFVRIALLGVQTLHLDQVEVFGVALDAGAIGGQPSFTTDCFSAFAPAWTSLFRAMGWDGGQPRTVVELGSFEGRASLWILDNLLADPASRLHCVDVFPDADHPASYGARHRRNILTSARANMVTTHARCSRDFLVDFLHDGKTVDFIYIDASHRAPDVLEDLVLGFRALKVGGVIICNDYLGDYVGGEGIMGTPKMAIDVFTTLFSDRLTIIRGQKLDQLAFIKTA